MRVLKGSANKTFFWQPSNSNAAHKKSNYADQLSLSAWHQFESEKFHKIDTIHRYINDFVYESKLNVKWLDIKPSLWKSGVGHNFWNINGNLHII